MASTCTRSKSKLHEIRISRRVTVVIGGDGGGVGAFRQPRAKSASIADVAVRLPIADILLEIV